MKKGMLLVGLLMCAGMQAQAQNASNAYYEQADEAFSKKDYKTTVSLLDKYDASAGGYDARSLRLRTESNRQLAFTDSARYMATYNKNVSDFIKLYREKKADPAAVDEVLKNKESFSDDKKLRNSGKLENLASDWPAEVFNVRVGMKQSEIPSDISGNMFQSPPVTKGTNGLNYDVVVLSRNMGKDPFAEGVSTIFLDNESRKVISITANTGRGSLKKDGTKGADIFAEKAAKLAAHFGKENITPTGMSTKIGKKTIETKGAVLNLNPATRHAVVYTTSGDDWFLTETYEVADLTNQPR